MSSRDPDDRRVPPEPGGPREPARPSPSPAPSRSGSEAPASPTLVAAPTLALPKGGGAIRPIGEKFSANPATGAGSFSLPIYVSPGRGGFQPDLTLSYDSGAGNGPFGLGWNLSAPSISRKTEKGLPRYVDEDESDVFVLSGAEDLVPALVESENGWARDVFVDEDERVYRYRPRVEGLFARIERRLRLSDGTTYWRSVTRENVTTIYGASEDARIADPADPKRVFRWLIEETYDDRGNRIVYEYEAEDGTGIDESDPCEVNRLGAGFANRYLKQIHYGNRSMGGDDWLFHVVFDYGEYDATPWEGEAQPWPVREDPFSTYRAGFEVRTYRLCRRVLMLHHFGEDPVLVRSSDLGHKETGAFSFVEWFRHTGYVEGPGGWQMLSSPKVELAYTEATFDGAIHRLDPESGANLPDGTAGRHQWVDLDGEGLAGVLVEQGPGWYYKRNLGSGRLGGLETVAERPSFTGLGTAAGSAGQLMELGADGTKYLVRTDEPPRGYSERLKTGWGPFRPFASWPNVSLSDPHAKLLDLDGDGLADLLISQHEVWRWHPSMGTAGFGPGYTTPRAQDEEKGPALVFADALETVFLADMSGDGLTDLARIRNGEVCYWPNLGYGRFGAKVSMRNPPLFDRAEQFDPKRLRLADVDGSGTTDLLYLDGHGARYWRNESGNGWSAASRLDGIPGADSGRQVEAVDLLGNGTTCLVWSSSLPAESGLRYVDLCGGVKPHLLKEVKNNLGAETRVTWAPSTKFFVADRTAGRPWVTKLPFPVLVVERVEHYDTVTKSRFVERHAYHHGHYDREEREFAGFGMVEQWDTEEFEAAGGTGLLPVDVANWSEALYVPPMHTKTWFHTGAFFDLDTISRHYAKEYFQGDPNPAARFVRDSKIPSGLSAKEAREAVRALRGKPLRVEIYADDGPPLSGIPYAATTSTYEVTQVQPLVAKQRHGVFFAHARDTIERHYERNVNDPRVTTARVLDVDDFGNIRASLQVAHGRTTQGAPAEQAKTWATYTETDLFHKADDPAWYRLGVPIESRTYEVTGPDLDSALPTLAELQAAEEIEFHETPDPNELQKRLLKRTFHKYAKNDQSAASNTLGQNPPVVESLALPYETYQLAFTTDQLTDAIPEGETYLTEAGYVEIDNEADLYWAPSGRQTFDDQHFYLPTEVTDPWGNETTIAYHDAQEWPYWLVPIEVTDAAENVVKATYDPRTLQPVTIEDANGAIAEAAYDALGRLVATAQKGKQGALSGDELPDAPTTTIEYTFGAPSRVKVLAREEHEGENANSRWQETYVYADGSGQEALRKMKAEAGPALRQDENTGLLERDGNGDPILDEDVPRWVGTGRTVLNNKGKPVKQYEPYFSSVPLFDQESELREWGVTPVLHYDPPGRVIRTDHPNGTFLKVAFDAWTEKTWDENDNVLASRWYELREDANTPLGTKEHEAAVDAAEHDDTPKTVHLDALGRPWLTEEDNDAQALYKTQTGLDVEGNVLWIQDARSFATNVDYQTLDDQKFDLLGRLLHSKSADAGESWSLSDVAGKPIYTKNANGHATRRVYDALRRPTHLWVKPSGGETFDLLAERTVYGDSLSDGATYNLRGRIVVQYDGAGRASHETYDFKGNVTSASRRVAAAYAGTPNWKDLEEQTLDPLLDPQNPPTRAQLRAIGTGLDATTYTTVSTYDALNRPVEVTAPDGSVTKTTWNEAGLVDKVDVEKGQTTTHFVRDVTYNAKGQRKTIVYGNTTQDEIVAETAYEYDPQTFRLIRLTTRRNVSAPDPTLVQDLYYTYDPVGNITHIEDEAQQEVFFANDLVVPMNRYHYDALYRLTSAEGREHIDQTTSQDQEFLPLGEAAPADETRMRNYTETYEYDPVGNITEMGHQVPVQTGSSWTRLYEYAAESNRLLSTSAGNEDREYEHDAAGNMTAMPHLPEMAWDYRNQLVRAEQANETVVSHFQYDASGERVRKVRIDANGARSERIYLGGFEIYRKWNAAETLVLRRETLHMMDSERRIALIEHRTDGNEGLADLTRYQFDNHLGSSSVELKGDGSLISYEEFHPYGTTSFHALGANLDENPKRYRYTGKERDEETGLAYHGARYYAPWVGRWTSADPAGTVDGPGLYSFVRNNPVAFVDAVGNKAVDPAVKALEDAQKAVLEKGNTDVNEILKHTPQPDSAKPRTLATFKDNRGIAHDIQLSLKYLYGGISQTLPGKQVAGGGVIIVEFLPQPIKAEDSAYMKAQGSALLQHHVFHEALHVAIERDKLPSAGSTKSAAFQQYSALKALGDSNAIAEIREAFNKLASPGKSGGNVFEHAIQELVTGRISGKAFGFNVSNRAIAGKYFSSIAKGLGLDPKNPTTEVAVISLLQRLYDKLTPEITGGNVQPGVGAAADISTRGAGSPVVPDAGRSLDMGGNKSPDLGVRPDLNILKRLNPGR